MASKPDKYTSRILREMHQNIDHPFDPASSTGEHGTVTWSSNLSTFSISPDGESTPRTRLPKITINEKETAPANITKSRSPASPNDLHSSVIRQSFPEWKGITSRRARAHQDEEKTRQREYTKDMQATVEDEVEPLSHTPASKPPTNVTGLLKTLKIAQAKDSQSRESSASLVSPKSHPAAELNRSPAARVRSLRHSTDYGSPAGHNQTARSFFLPNLTHMNDFVSGALRWSTLRNGMPIFVKHGKVQDRESKATPDQHADFESLSIPEEEEKIFVSLDKIREEINELKDHDELVSRQAEQLQDEVHQLHVQIAKHKSRKDSAMGSDSESSMIEQLSTQRNELQSQILSLQSQLDKANRKISINEIHTQSFVGERDEALMNVSEHVKTIRHLQAGLDQARNELEAVQNGHTRDSGALESENRSLRKEVANQANQLKRLELDYANKQMDIEIGLKTNLEQLEASRTRSTREISTLELENKSLRSDNNSIRQQWKSLLEENQSLRNHNSSVIQCNQELEEDAKLARAQLESANKELAFLKQKIEQISSEKMMLKEDNFGLDRNNNKLYGDTKALQQKNSMLERRNEDLEREMTRLQQLLDDAEEAQTGTMGIDFKEVRNRLESQNRALARENAEFSQKMIDMQVEFSAKRAESRHERHRLVSTNQRLTDELDDLTKKVAQLESRQSTQETKSSFHTANKTKPLKVTRFIDPKSKHTVSEYSARSMTSQTDLPMQEDYTQQIDLTQDSSQYDALKSTNSARLNSQKNHAAEATVSRQKSDQDLSGRFSIKSGNSGMSIQSGVSQEDIFNRGYTPSTRLDIDSDHGENMTSALFMEDITLQTSKRAARKQKAKTSSAVDHPPLEEPKLSPVASRVLHNLCVDHKCVNCTLCSRITARRHEKDGSCSRKKTVRVERPVPVSSRSTKPTPSVAGSEYEDQPTIRPSQNPGAALAKVIKGLKDEDRHLKLELQKKQKIYDDCDPAMNKRVWKKLGTEIAHIQKRRDLKRDQIYSLYDVVEGQKQSQQEMTEEALDLTINSVLSRDPTWNGVADY